MTTSMPGHSGRAMPSLQRVSVAYTDATTPVDILTTATTLLTCGELYACNNPTIVMASIMIDERDGTALRFILNRDGVEIDATQRFGQNVVNAAGLEVVSLLWFDTAPGNDPAYSISALADAWGGGNYNQMVAYSCMAAFI